MNTIIKAGHSGGRWIAFKEGADLSEFDETKLSDWAFSGKDATMGSLIRASDGVTDFGLKRDDKGRTDAGAYAVAYDVSFGVEHLKTVEGPAFSLENPTRKQTQTIPQAILREYVFRADTSRGVTMADLDCLRKPKTDEDKADDDSENDKSENDKSEGDEKKG